jgi:hypothetical protein
MLIWMLQYTVARTWFMNRSCQESAKAYSEGVGERHCKPTAPLQCLNITYLTEVHPECPTWEVPHGYQPTNSVALVRERSVPTERPPLVGEVWVSHRKRISYRSQWTANFASKVCLCVTFLGSFWRGTRYLYPLRMNCFCCEEVTSPHSLLQW